MSPFKTLAFVERNERIFDVPATVRRLGPFEYEVELHDDPADIGITLTADEQSDAKAYALDKCLRS